MTSYKPAYIYQLIHKRSIPYIKTGHKILFEKSELEQWLLKGHAGIK